MSDGVERGTSERPLLQIITPGTTAEEVAAIVAVFAALGGGGAPSPARPVSQWASVARRVAVGHRPGPGAWRASALPR